MAKEKHPQIINIHCMPKETMLRYFSMSLDERLTELQKYTDMGRIMEDTVVFAPGQELNMLIPEERRFKELGPQLSYKGMGWSSVDPHMRASVISGEKRAENIINNLKSKKQSIIHVSLKKLLEKLKRKSNKNKS